MQKRGQFPPIGYDSVHILLAGIDPYFAFRHSRNSIEMLKSLRLAFNHQTPRLTILVHIKDLTALSILFSNPYPESGMKSTFLLNFSHYRESIPESRSESPVPP